MPFYHRLGEVPPKRHSVFQHASGALYHEELIGNHGFAGPSSLLYHVHRPTEILRAAHRTDLAWQAEHERVLKPRHFLTTRMRSGPSPTLDRTPLLFNREVALSVAEPAENDEFFYRNAQGDEVVYVTEGGGVLESPMGELAFRPGDYLVIPRGIVHRYRLEREPCRFLVMESAGQVRIPKRYRNDEGQLMEHAPYAERDVRRPSELKVHEEKGEFLIVVKRDNALNEILVAAHPFDVAGWDGYYYPWAFNIHDFEPRVGRFHLPPPVHQTFEGDGFVICSFCPRPNDFDAKVVPAPYHHSNVMSDEVLYYANREFMSHKGIQYGSVTLHPDGLPHGPHPGKTEESIGKAATNELAVMVDTFHPLRVSLPATMAEDRDYFRSWRDQP